jgi:hypothetical protein
MALNIWSATITARTRTLTGAQLALKSINYRSFNSTPRAGARPPLWTFEDDNKLLKCRESGKTWDNICREFPHRTPRALKNRYYEIAPKDPSGTPLLANVSTFNRPPWKRWSLEEDSELLKSREQGQGWEAIRSKFPHRSIEALYKLYARIGPRERSGALVHKSTMDNDDHEKIRRLRAQGFLWKDVRTLHFPQFSISALMVASRKPASKSIRVVPWTAVERERLIHLRHEKKLQVNCNYACFDCADRFPVIGLP